MSENSYKKSVKQWRYKKKLEKFNSMIEKMSQKKGNEESTDLKIKSFKVYKYGTKKQ